jgi:hypothetical protein
MLKSACGTALQKYQLFKGDMAMAQSGLTQRDKVFINDP